MQETNPSSTAQGKWDEIGAKKGTQMVHADHGSAQIQPGPAGTSQPGTGAAPCASTSSESLVPWEFLKAIYLQQLPCDHPQHVAVHSLGGQG